MRSFRLTVSFTTDPVGDSKWHIECRMFMTQLGIGLVEDTSFVPGGMVWTPCATKVLLIRS
jgi:hypothetical protein